MLAQRIDPSILDRLADEDSDWHFSWMHIRQIEASMLEVGKIFTGYKNIFFTSDHHFGHEKIIDYTNRPFVSVAAMDDVLITRWNMTVPKDGTVYYLGDLCLGDNEMASYYLSKLNGNIFFVTPGNHHDKRWLRLEGGFPNVRGETRTGKWRYVKEIAYLTKPHRIIMYHFPIAIWDRKHYGAWHLHGHSHGNYQGDGFSLDVGVDNMYNLVGRYEPMSFEFVAGVMIAKGWTKDWTQFDERKDTNGSRNN